MQNNEPKIVVIVALYQPNKDELENIKNYVDEADLCLLMDDSDYNNENMAVSYFESKNVKYCWNEKNIGLCASVNRGILLALNENADWILLMNGDSKIEPSVISDFRTYIMSNDTKNIACLAPQYNYDRHPRRAYEGTKKIRWANMSGMCINCNCLSEIDVFDERLFIDGLDIDWGIRAKIAGYEMIEIGTAIMDHHPAETKAFKIFGKTIFLYGWANPVRYYYQFRSNHYMIKKYRSFEAMKWQIIKLLKVLFLFDNKREYLRMYRKAIRDCKLNNWGKISFVEVKR